MQATYDTDLAEEIEDRNAASSVHVSSAGERHPYTPAEQTWIEEGDGELFGGEKGLLDWEGYGYFKKPDGWIFYGLANPSNVKFQEDAGNVYLKQYGNFMLTPPLKKGPNGKPMPQWAPGITNSEPYQQILLKDGGPEEFSIEQIHELGWDREGKGVGCIVHRYDDQANGQVKRAQIRVRFPQLRGVDPVLLMHFECSFCKSGPYSTEVGRDTHVRIFHPEQASLFALTKTQAAMAKAIEGTAGGAMGNDAILKEMMAMFGQAIASQQEQINGLVQALAGRIPSATTSAPTAASSTVSTGGVITFGPLVTVPNAPETTGKKPRTAAQIANQERFAQAARDRQAARLAAKED